MKAVINRKRYDTSTAIPLADNEFADGRNSFPDGRRCTLYRTKNDRYFAHHETLWEGEHDCIEPLTLEEAEHLYTDLPSQFASFEEAFPEIPVDDA